MTDTALEIFLILVLLVANGVFSASEIAVVSAKKVRLEQLVKKGNKQAKLALKLANSPNDFLSTVQIGITLIGILSGAVGGATLAEKLKHFLDSFPLLAAYSQILSLAVVVGLITYLSLVIGELLPKRLALTHPEQIACRIAGPMRLLSKLTAPFVHLLGISTDSLLNIMGIHPSEEPSITEEEITVLIEQGTLAGTFEAAEQQMVSRVFRLGDRPIRALMTPRTEIDWLDIESSTEEMRQLILEISYSRLPVCEESIDNCLGIVRVKNLLDCYLRGEIPDLKALLQPPLYVAEATRALKVLELFKNSGTHIALVVDEYGGIEGLVTLNDIAEAIVGEVPSSESSEEPMIISCDDGTWLLDGFLPIDDLKGLLKQERLPNEEEEYHTLGGLMISALGKIPRSGDHFEWQGFRFQVVDMDGTRVDKVMVVPLPPEASSELISQENE